MHAHLFSDLWLVTFFLLLFKRLNHHYWSQVGDTTLAWGTNEKAMGAANRDNTLRYSPTTKGRVVAVGGSVW